LVVELEEIMEVLGKVQDHLLLEDLAAAVVEHDLAVAEELVQLVHLLQMAVQLKLEMELQVKEILVVVEDILKKVDLQELAGQVLRHP
jgi:hypothetical protein